MHDRYRAVDHVELRAIDETLTAHAARRFAATVALLERGRTDARNAFEVVRGAGIDGDH